MSYASILPKLFAWFIAFVFLMLGIACFHRGLSPKTSNLDFGARSEEYRMLTDPRFIATTFQKPEPNAKSPDRE